MKWKKKRRIRVRGSENNKKRVNNEESIEEEKVKYKGRLRRRRKCRKGEEKQELDVVLIEIRELINHRTVR